QFRLAAIVAAAQLAQHGMLHAVAAPRQIVAGFNIHWWRVEQFIHDGTGVGFRLLWPDRRAGGGGAGRGGGGGGGVGAGGGGRRQGGGAAGGGSCGGGGVVVG